MVPRERAETMRAQHVETIMWGPYMLFKNKGIETQRATRYPPPI